MKTILVVTLMLMGQERPVQNTAEMKDLAQCEVQAHEFMTHKFADDVQGKITFRSAACAAVPPDGKDT